jgi:hypothetical protein
MELYQDFEVTFVTASLKCRLFRVRLPTSIVSDVSGNLLQEISSGLP